jgi:hypothetical protein
MATVPATFLANFGSTNSVGVQNPPPGGGTTVTTQTVTLPTFVVVAPVPVNDNFANAISITGNTFTDTKDSSAATTQTSDPAPPCSQNPAQIPFTTGISNTIWYKFTPTSNGTITDVDTIGSSYDSVLSIWTGSGTTETSLTATLVACNDDIVPMVITQSQIQGVAVTSGTTYYIMVSSFGQADPNPVAFGGKSILNFTFSGTANNPTPVITPPLVPASTTAGGAAFTLTINGTSFVSGATVTFGTTTGLVPSALTATQIMVTIPATAIATAGTPAVTVTNPAPGGGPSNSVTFTVNANTGTFTATGPANPVAITAGSSANVAITLTPTGGFTSAGVTISCPTLPPGVHCPTTALSIPVPNANPATGQLSVSVDAPAAANATASVLPDERRLYAAGLTLASGGKGWWTLSAITGLGAVLLLLLPGRKRYRAALALGLLCILSFTLGCSTSGGGGGGGGGPVATTTHITVTSATKGPTTTAFTFTATVTGGTPTDMVQLFDGTTAIGTAVAVSGGTANLSTGNEHGGNARHQRALRRRCHQYASLVKRLPERDGHRIDYALHRGVACGFEWLADDQHHD